MWRLISILCLALLCSNARAGITVSPVTGSGGGGGSGVVSNYVFMSGTDTLLTNSTAYSATVSARLASADTTGTRWGFQVDTNLDGTFDYSAEAYNLANAQNSVISNTVTLTVPAGASFRTHVWTGVHYASSLLYVITYTTTNNSVAFASSAGAAASANIAQTATNLYGNSLVRNAYYVDNSNGSDTTGDGSSGKPWSTTGKAETNAVYGSTIYVGSGTYTQPFTRGGITWVMSRGSRFIQTDSNVPVFQFYANTNYTFLGEGSFENTASGAFISNFDGATVFDCDFEIQARFFQGTVQLYYDQTRKNRFCFRDMLWLGNANDINPVGGGFGGDIRFENVAMYNLDAATFDTSITHPFVLIGCTARVTPTANSYRVGAWLTNTNMHGNFLYP